MPWDMPKLGDASNAQVDRAAGSGKKKRTASRMRESQKGFPAGLDYRTWLSLQAASVAQAGCIIQVLGLIAAFLRANWHGLSASWRGGVLRVPHCTIVDAIAVSIYICSYCIAAVILLYRPRMCEACFILNITMRIFLAAMFGLKLLPPTATFHLIVSLHMEKIEVLLMAPIEQVRFNWMVLLRVLLTLSYAYVYIRNEQPYPWISALLVHGSALLFQWLTDIRYRKVYAQCFAPQPRLKASGSADKLQQGKAALTKGALLSSKDMQAGVEGKQLQQQQDLNTAAVVPLYGTPDPDANMGIGFQEPSSSSFGSGSASTPGMGSGSMFSVLSPRSHGRTTGAPGRSAQVGHTSNPLVFRGGYQQNATGAAAAARPIDPTTKARLRQVHKCLDRSRPKYTTHFSHHKASLKVPCNSNPSSLTLSALSEFSSLVSSSREKEVEVLSAAMRAGCILVVLDLREAAAPLPDGTSEDKLGQLLANAAKQWLHDTNLDAEIAEDTPVALQVNGSVFLCHLKNCGREWSMEGPLPAAPSAGTQAKLTAASPTVLLPASSTDAMKLASFASVSAAAPKESAAAAAAAAALVVAEGKGQQGADACAAGGSGPSGPHMSVAPGSARSASSSSTRVMGSNSSGKCTTGSSKCTTTDASHTAEVGGGNSSPAPPSQQVAQRDPSGSVGNGEVDVTVRVWVHVPGDVQVEGWEGDGDGNGGGAWTSLPANADAATAGSKEGVKQVEGNHTGAPAAAAPLSIVARAFDQYLVTRVAEVLVRKPAAEGEAWLMEVHVSLPAPLAALAPGPLCMELWGHHTLLGHCTQLLLPSEQAQIAAELQSFTSWDSSEGQDYIMDLCSWLSATHCPAAQAHSDVGLSSSAAAAAAASQASAQSAFSTQGLSKDEALGMALLRQAVLWGVPALASLLLERILEGCPSTHAAFAQLAHAPQGACWSRAKGKGVSVSVDDQEMARQGGLLHLALLSANQHAMLATVLAWGRQWGGSGAKAFEWGWLERNAEGLTPLEIAVGSVVPSGFLGSEDGGGGGAAAAANDGAAEKSDGRPGGDEIEGAESAQHGGDEIEAASGPAQQPMLSEEAQKGAEAGLDLLRFSHALESSQLEELVLNLLDPTQPELSNAPAHGQQTQEQLHWEALKLHGHPDSPFGNSFMSSGELVTVPSALQSTGRPGASSSSATAAGRSSNEPFEPPPRHQPPAAAGSGRASLRDAFHATLYGFSGQGKAIEEEYRSWCGKSTARLTNNMSRLAVILCGSGAILSLRKQLYANAAVMITYIIANIGVLLVGLDAPKRREFALVVLKLTHWSLVVCFGLNILPSLFVKKLALTHTDVLLECCCSRFAHQVQLQALVTERLSWTFALGLLYSSLNMPWPILQAVVINLVSLIVGIALDVRNRRTYMQVCSSSAHAAKKAKTL